MKNIKTRGFTLVEIIIVLVILAIIAAAALPALTGYIDKAKEMSAVSEARTCYTAAQTALLEYYATNDLKGYLETKENQYRVAKTDKSGNPVLDKKGNVTYEYVKAGRVSNSTFHTIQYNTDKRPENAGDTEIGTLILQYLDSPDKSKSSRYLFAASNNRLGKNTSMDTADEFFKVNPKDSIALNIYYDKTGHVIMIHFAKPGYGKIIEMYPSGTYQTVETVSVK
ncbi:MAG: prepilin-type N-terminal cleavage/methylation domain-containing protein [Treponema sp.]|uniref:prepilin-type N-terminal cleavage/methylation domain-containing protein n=1 Tax=Treponema sp. TaxID=166 RepID=UPI00298DDA60|nr:prepilin-type N-terminal cleavage/methylation domain-containing protein [Treponema sp.]MCQ2601719.1 prepilin-type N-terminal cleavage/methylation domain-containing protein [Treponema sp.]